MSFLRTTKTETTQQRVWCSTGIRYRAWSEAAQSGIKHGDWLCCTDRMSLCLQWQDYVDAPLTIPVCFTQNLNIDWTQYQVTSRLSPPLELWLSFSQYFFVACHFHLLFNLQSALVMNHNHLHCTHTVIFTVWFKPHWLPMSSHAYFKPTDLCFKSQKFAYTEGCI